MTDHDSATPPSAIAVGSGTLLALLGVVSFSFSFPATAWALTGFDPWTVTGLRGLLAGLLAAACLAVSRVPVPARQHWPGLLTVAGGCVVGFPLLTALALRTSTTAHTAVVVGLLPLATAAISALLTGRRPSPAFWVSAGVGALAVAAFTLEQSRGMPSLGDLWLLCGLLLCGAGYAEGGRLAAHMPGWHVIAWGVVAALPVSMLIAALSLAGQPVHVTARAAVGMVYIAAVSQFGGFVLWYRGMGAIGVPRASQMQLAQPLLTLVWAVLLLGERMSPMAPITAVVVLGCIAVTQRARA